MKKNNEIIVQTNTSIATILAIKDNAQAHGCKFGSHHTNSLSDTALHSFYPEKKKLETLGS